MSKRNALADAANVSNEPWSALFRVPYVLMQGLAERAHDHMAECAVEAGLARAHMAECAAEADREEREAKLLLHALWEDGRRGY